MLCLGCYLGELYSLLHGWVSLLKVLEVADCFTDLSFVIK